MQPKEILKKYFGYDNFRPMQEEVIRAILNKRDTLAIMPTGSGKSLCFQIPSMIFPHGSLVISPLISLMKDQVETLNEQGIKATYVNSTVPYEETIERLRELYRGNVKLLYLAPEKLEASYFTHCLKQVPLSMIVIDEAHCVSQWGHDFRPSYGKIRNFIETLPQKPVVAALTATATLQVQKDMLESLGLKNAKFYKTGLDRPNLSFSVITGGDKKEFIESCINAHKGESGIIYCATRKAVDELYEFFKEKGYEVGKYHAGMDDDQRKSEQEDFSYDRKQIMIATNAFGMGIDKSNIRYIIHYQMPKSIEAYYQEAGRSGRDGSHAECILLYAPKDSRIQKYLIEQKDSDKEQKLKEYQRLNAMIDYCRTTMCLRNHILNYFGEKTEKNCDRCGNCLTQKAKTDTTDIATIVFRTIKIVQENYGQTTIADILKGRKTKAIKERKLDKIPTYARLKFENIKNIKTMLANYIADGYLKREGTTYPVLKLTEKSKNVLDGKEKVHMIATSAVNVIKETITKKKTHIVKENTNFEKLRELRKEIASEEKVPPFVIFTDATLIDMLEKMPTNESEMEKVKGVGTFKLKKYGKRFIEKIKEILNEKETKNEKKKEKVKTNKTENKISETDKVAFSLYIKKVFERIKNKNNTSEAMCEINENLIKFLYTNKDLEKYLNDNQKKHKEEIQKAIETYRHISGMEVR